ncbi:MAG: dTMP kinase [Bacilli bacterium]
MNKRSYFITFEGPEGSGKTTIINMVAQYLKTQNKDFIATREPGGSKIAEKIRDIILDTKNAKLSANTEALLYAASRAQHFDDLIKPALLSNKIIICDRFLDSSLAYQGIARNLGLESIYDINRFAINNTLPDLTIFFDLKPEIGLQRIKENNLREVNRLDLEGLSFHQKVYDGYLKVIELQPQRFKIIDASNDIETVFKQTIEAIEELINNE